MALLDELLGDLVQTAKNPDTQAKISELVKSAIGSEQGQALTQHVNAALAGTSFGSVQGLVDEFQKSGLAAHVQSWLTGGPSAPIDAQQVESAFGPQLNQLGTALGLPPETVSHVLSQVLPGVVSHAGTTGDVTAPAAPAAPSAPATPAPAAPSAS